MVDYAFSNDQTIKLNRVRRCCRRTVNVFIQNFLRNNAVLLNKEWFGYDPDNVGISDFWSNHLDRIVVAGGFPAAVYQGEMTLKDVDIFILDCSDRMIIPEILKSNPSNTAAAATADFDLSAVQAFPPPSWSAEKRDSASHPRPNEIIDSAILGQQFSVTIDTAVWSDNPNEYRYITNVPINLVTTKYKTRRALLNHFDMVGCQMSYVKGSTDDKEKIYFTEDTLKCIENRIILRNPMTAHETIAPWRLRRYKDLDWKEPDYGQRNSF